jgi:hypothetical protein
MMIRYDLAYCSPRLRPAEIQSPLFIYKSQELSKSLCTSDIRKAIDEYMAGDFDPIKLLEIEINKALPAIKESSSEPTVSAKNPSLKLVKPAGTEKTSLAPMSGTGENKKMYPDTMSNLTKEVNTPEHALAAHRVLANHHLSNYYNASANGDEKQASHFAVRHFAHANAAKELESQGVKDLPEHHMDLYNHYSAKMQKRTDNPDPIKLEEPYYSAAQAQVDHLKKIGHGSVTGETDRPEPSTKQSTSPNRLYQGNKYIGIPSTHPIVSEPYSRLAAQQNLAKLGQPGVSMAPSKSSGEDEKTRKSNSIIQAMTALLKASKKLNKNYEYGGVKEMEKLTSSPIHGLPLSAELRQDKKLDKKRSDARKKQTLQEFQNAQSSLKAINSLKSFEN